MEIKRARQMDRMDLLPQAIPAINARSQGTGFRIAHFALSRQAVENVDHSSMRLEIAPTQSQTGHPQRATSASCVHKLDTGYKTAPWQLTTRNLGKAGYHRRITNAMRVKRSDSIIYENARR